MDKMREKELQIKMQQVEKLEKKAKKYAP